MLLQLRIQLKIRSDGHCNPAERGVNRRVSGLREEGTRSACVCMCVMCICVYPYTTLLPQSSRHREVSVKYFLFVYLYICVLNLRHFYDSHSPPIPIALPRLISTRSLQMNAC